ncbi:uncharacterized protein LOC109599158 [Aethina tumida]|uniref:uncharacterized protein LOC109599158 n=1 Tax=Aethina tumida TaxID=116153 RepID=UPI00096B23A5|nr:uncharacterized protein LOC109599158 [Aethina tumida]
MMPSKLARDISFIILQVFWTLHLFYEHYILRIKRNTPTKNEASSPSIASNDPKSKRHVIQLITEPRGNARPLCYMKVHEVISPFEEELLRRACAKGITNENVINVEEPTLPKEVVSRMSFTNDWVDSLVMTV